MYFFKRLGPVYIVFVGDVNGNNSCDFVVGNRDDLADRPCLGTMIGFKPTNSTRLWLIYVDIMSSKVVLIILKMDEAGIFEAFLEFSENIFLENQRTSSKSGGKFHGRS